MATSDKSLARKLAAIYRAEAAEHLQRMRACLGQLEAAEPAGAAAEALAGLLRAAHSLKGAARAVGAQEVEGICHTLESLLLSLQRGRRAWSPALADGVAEVLRGLERAVQGPEALPGVLVDMTRRLERLEREPAAGALAPAQHAPAEKPAEEPAAQPGALAAAAASAAAEISAADAAGSGPEVRIGLQRLARLLYQAEELVAAKLDGARHVTDLSAALDACSALRPGWEAPAAAAQAWQELEARLRALKGSATREQRQLAGAVDALLEDVKQALLLPARSLRPMLQATVQQLARSEGKEVELRIEDGALELDRRLVEALQDPLVHLLRNAIGHGIESPAQRAAAGKPPLAVLTVAISPRPGGRAEITVRDDGRGIDTARLAQLARERQWPLPADPTPEDLLPLVFLPGFSTAERVTRVAGRGLGLPIVRDTVERLGGTVTVRSELGRGTTFTLSLSLSFAIYRAVEVQAGGRSFLLPTTRVEHCLRLAPAQLRELGRQQTITLGEHDLPLVPLAGLLGLPAASTAPMALHCVVLEAGQRRIAMAVDAIRGEQEVLGKPMEGPLASSPLVAGAAVLGSGLVAAVLNVSELVRTALREGGRGAGSALVVPRPRGASVLLAEDSITSRTLLKNILELAGHTVVVAVDGSDALVKLRAGSFDLVVSDVEMPRLDGFALTEEIRRDPALARLPVILVTSLSSPADRERGAEAGANAYIVKSGFDQGNLLNAIEELA